jgi:hypothetical protein
MTQIRRCHALDMTCDTKIDSLCDTSTMVFYYHFTNAAVDGDNRLLWTVTT